MRDRTSDLSLALAADSFVVDGASRHRGASTRRSTSLRRLSERFFASFVDSGFFGANVTIPHKTAALEMTVLEDALPARLRAINTVYVRNDAPYGANTDVAGFAAALRVAGIEKFPRGSRGVVIGAGGAARAVMSVLLEAGIEDLRVVSRSLVRGREALNSFPRASDDALWHPFEDLERILSEAAVAVNASPLGMKGAPPLEIPLDALPRESAAIDLVYVPVETPFLRRARERGHPVADGLDMLFAQAAESFRLWHGVLPPIDDDLRAMTVADINREIEGGMIVA